MKKILFILIIVSASTFLWAQKSQVKWYTLQEAEKLAKTNPKPIIVDTYTDWCGYCKKLDSETFSNPQIAEILNSRFYPVKFNAEGKQPVTFQGKTYINDGKSGPTHQLTLAMLQGGQIGYPTLVFFNEQVQMLAAIPGFQTSKQLEPLLAFIADKAYEKQNFQEFSKSFRGKLQQ